MADYKDTLEIGEGKQKQRLTLVPSVIGVTQVSRQDLVPLGSQGFHIVGEIRHLDIVLLQLPEGMTLDNLDTTPGVHFPVYLDEYGGTVILTDRIALRMQPNVTPQRRQEFLERYDLELMRESRYKPQDIVVRAKSRNPIKAWELSQELSLQTDDVAIATPDLVASVHLA